MDTAKLTDMVIARFGDRWDLVGKSELFIKYEAEVSRRVGGGERGVVDFGNVTMWIVGGLQTQAVSHTYITLIKLADDWIIPRALLLSHSFIHIHIYMQIYIAPKIVRMNLRRWWWQSDGNSLYIQVGCVQIESITECPLRHRSVSR